MYNCKVGFKVREMVGLRRLRPPPQEGTLVQVPREAGEDAGFASCECSEDGEVEGRIMASVAWGMTNLSKYPDYEVPRERNEGRGGRQVLLEDGTVLRVAFDQLKRCFKGGQLVEVYMGRQFGWAARIGGQENAPRSM